MSSIIGVSCYINDMSVNITFGEWLGDELHKRGWKVQHFADTIDVGRTTVSSWLHNHKPPRLRNCRRIAQALGIDENEVLVRAGYPPRDPGYRLGEGKPERSSNETEQQYRWRMLASSDEPISDEAWEAIERILELDRRNREGR
jgi:transcriptional regulator with XRE-family HTH domain